MICLDPNAVEDDLVGYSHPRTTPSAIFRILSRSATGASTRTFPPKPTTQRAISSRWKRRKGSTPSQRRLAP